MINNILTRFSIKDLENLSGIKAHTIRIWEKRYGILTPDRTETNIRYYSITSLQKLLNVVYLYDSGQKISRLAQLTDSELQLAVRELSALDQSSAHIAPFILSALKFDQQLFDQSYQHLLQSMSFRALFLDVFVPLLHNIGLQWQSEAILPVHEHFISNLIKQKLLVNTERIQSESFQAESPLYVLFLPLNEIHELGLLYIHYELLLNGKRSIYLGCSVPIENLLTLHTQYTHINFISYFTVQPAVEDVISYLEQCSKSFLRSDTDKLYVLGRNTQHIHELDVYPNVKVFKGLADLIVSLM